MAIVTVPAGALLGAPPQANGATAAQAAPARLYFLDYLRAGVVALVMLHHTAITYGGGGSWYDSDPTTSKYLAALFDWFVAVNQSWFMAFLFFLSGYLSLASYTGKGAGRYVRDRLRRLGIPLIVYLLVISPIVTWLTVIAAPGAHPSLIAYWLSQYLTFRITDTGPLWFVWGLLLMDLLFVVWARWLSRTDLAHRTARSFPNRRWLAAFALALGAVSFLTHQGYPVGQTILFGLQIAYFPSYVAMFVLGFVAWRCRWLDDIPDRAFRFARLLSMVGVVAFPFLLVAVAATASNPAAALAGGLHWQALAYSLWEPWVLIGMSIVLLRWGQRRLNRASATWQPWASASYIAYIVQPLAIVAFAIALQGAPLPALVKFAIVGAASIPASFLIARMLRLVPVIRTVIG